MGHLGQARNIMTSSSSVQQKELNWLLKIAWNLALKCDNYYKEMAELFSVCHELCSQLPSQVHVLKRQRSCQLMAAAARLQVAGSTTDRTEKVSMGL